MPDDLYERLAQHFSTRQIMDRCFTAGIADTINRVHATFLTDVDDETLADEAVTEGGPVLREGAAS